MKLGLVSCSLSKDGQEGPAREVYTSRTFNARLKLCELTCDRVMILSGKYGAIDPDRIIFAYETWLRTWSLNSRVSWQAYVLQQVIDEKPSEVVIHAGYHYYAPFLESGLIGYGAEVTVPTRGMTNLETFSWLKEELDKHDYDQ